MLTPVVGVRDTVVPLLSVDPATLERLPEPRRTVCVCARVRHIPCTCISRVRAYPAYVHIPCTCIYFYGCTLVCMHSNSLCLHNAYSVGGRVSNVGNFLYSACSCWTLWLSWHHGSTMDSPSRLTKPSLSLCVHAVCVCTKLIISVSAVKL